MLFGLVSKVRPRFPIALLYRDLERREAGLIEERRLIESGLEPAMHSIRPMTVSDLGDGMRLKAEAGWNQTDADWRRFWALGGDGCFVAEREGRVVGSVTSCRLATVGWVAMLLVEKAFRGSGIGRSLLIRCVEHLESTGATSIRLDATPEGRPLYESLAFRVDFSLHRHCGIARTRGTAEMTRRAQAADLPLIASLDRVVTRTDRRSLIERLIEDNPVESLVAGPDGGPISGFALWRPGSSAVQVGPCVAERDAGRALLNEVGRRLEGRQVIVDIPADNVGAVSWADGDGLTRSRQFWRMTRGAAVVEDQDRLWASSGPEMG
jgi:ribosomal protein S18 acetylase RimI-like enzyme